MTKLQVAQGRLDRIESALASMQQALAQARARINELTWPDISNLEAVAKEVEDTEWFWAAINDVPATSDPETVEYIEIATGTTVNVVHVEGRVAYLDDGKQAWLKYLRRPRCFVSEEQALADAQDEAARAQAALDELNRQEGIRFAIEQDEQNTRDDAFGAVLQ